MGGGKHLYNSVKIDSWIITIQPIFFPGTKECFFTKTSTEYSITAIFLVLNYNIGHSASTSEHTVYYWLFLEFHLTKAISQKLLFNVIAVFSKKTA